MCGRNAHVLEKALRDTLDAVLSPHRTLAESAAAIASRPPQEQDFILHWTKVIAHTSAELAFQFAAVAPAALTELSTSSAEHWVVHAVDVYDREGLHRSTEALRQFREFADAATTDVTLEEVVTVLQIYLLGLAGTALRIESAPRPYTDTETIYLPPRISGGRSRAENFLRYKATVALLWAQMQFGTYTIDIAGACAAHPDPQRALELLGALENVRLEALLSRKLPALARDAADLRNRLATDPRCLSLLGPTATIHDSIAMLARLYDAPLGLENVYAPVLKPEQAEAAKRARAGSKKEALRAALAKLLKEQACGDPIAFTAEKRGDRELSDAGEYVLALDGVAVTPPAEVARLLDSVWQDLGEIPDECLMPGGDAGAPETAGGVPDVVDERYTEAAYHYDEWDHVRRHYRKRWCALRESDVAPGDEQYVAEVYARNASRIAQLRRTFELIRGEEGLLKRQPDGDAIDLDALVAGYSEMRTGTELPSLLFTRRRRNDRDLAVMFMVDMSGSTKGWINDAQREALVMLCEALEAIGDRYAIYGFSGITRRNCEVYRVKRFDEPYGAQVRGRIAGIEPQDYTRMGAAIRHLTMRLDSIAARTKLLITLSDGKPEDYSDNYRGEYAIEDTRQALLEAHRRAIRPFCITIDHEARDYLPHMYGAANWTLVDDVSKLPLKVADIYRHLAD